MTDFLSNSPFRGLGGLVFLIGFMGSGKTHWGKVWAKQSGMLFYDLDEVIENAAGKPVAHIFEKNGEDYFRKIERDALHGFAGKNNCIIACGGGTPCFYNNMQWMNENGFTVYLSASPQYIYDRVIGEKTKRPLLKKINDSEILFFIEQKIKEREPFYKQATFNLQADELGENSLSILNNKP